MTKKKYALLLTSLLLTPYTDAQLLTPKENPTTKIYKIYKKKYINKHRYEIPQTLTRSNPKFRNLSEPEKEKQLLEWFLHKEKKRLSYLITWELIKQCIITIAMALFLFITLGKIYLSIFNACYEVITALLKTSQGKKNILETKLKQIKRNSILFTIMDFFFDTSSNNVNMNLKDQNTTGFMELFILYNILTYLLVPMSWFFKKYEYIDALYSLLLQPTYNTLPDKLDQFYIKKSYLFNTQKKQFIEKRLLQAHNGDIENIEELAQTIEILALLPKEIKVLTYNQQAINLAFNGYPPHIKALAENIIAMLSLYTDTVANGREDLLQKLPIKPILIIGGTSSGKSHFIRKLQEVTGLNLTYMNLSDELPIKFMGENINNNTVGSPSVYIKALINSANKRKRNFQNNILVLEEINDYLNNETNIEYLKILLDPKIKNMHDLYLQMYIPKLTFTIATSTHLPKDPALRDRFMIYYINPPKKIKKKYIIHKVIEKWVDFLGHPALQNGYNKKFNKKELTENLMQDADEFIDNHDQSMTIRKSEGKVLLNIMEQVKEKVKKKSQEEINEQSKKENHEEVSEPEKQ